MELAMAKQINIAESIHRVPTEADAERPKVLLVDEDPDYLIATSVGLRAAGYDVVTANGVRATEKLLGQDGFRIDASVIDLMMERTDSGLTLCHLLKGHFSGCPILMVSAVASDAGLLFDPSGPGGEWMKVDCFLSKPVSLEQLQRELCRLLDRQSTGTKRCA
jgi:two-component system alkaline phosphatase synthesis response regulator PhoP